MQHYLLDQYPEGVVPLNQFGVDHPEILPVRRSRAYIDRLESEPEIIQRVFRKRFNRWFIHVPSLIDYLENESSLLKRSA